MSPFVVVARLSLRQLFSGRRLAASIVLGLLPVLLSLAVIGVRQALGLKTLTPLAFYRDFVPAWFHTWAILASIMFATSAVSDDEEDGSVIYLLIRPIRRGLVYLGKLAAATTATLLVLLPSVGLTWLVLAVAGSGIGANPNLALLGKDLGWLTLAAIAYPSAFAAVAVMGRRLLHLAAGFLFLWEVPLAFAPTSLRLLTVSHYLLSVMPHTRLWHAAVSTLGMSTGLPGALVGLAALTTFYLAVGSIRYERKEHVAAAEA